MTKQVHSKSGTNTGGQSKTSKLKDKKSQAGSKSNTKSHQNAAATVATASVTAVASNSQKQAVDSKLLTPEQRRLASLMNDKIDVNDIEKKINKIIELTGASKDKAIVALHDCANELDKAIDMILEGDSLNEGEWKSQVRKKKPKVTTTTTVNNKENTADFAGGRHLNGETRRGGKREGPPRGERPLRGKGDFRRNGTRDNNSNFTKEITNVASIEPDSNVPTGDSWETVIDGDWGEPVTASVPDFNTTSDSFNTKPRYGSSGYSKSAGRSGNNDRPQTRGSYAGKAGSAPNRSGPGRTYQNKNFKDGGNFPNSIDTWSNDDGTTNTNQQSNATNEFDNKIGNWSDMAEVEAVSDDDWDAPMETKVFTSSRTNDSEKPKMPNLAEIVSGVKPKQPTAAAIVKGLASTNDSIKPVSIETASSIKNQINTTLEPVTPGLTEQITNESSSLTVSNASTSINTVPSSQSTQQLDRSSAPNASVLNQMLPIISNASSQISQTNLPKSSQPTQPQTHSTIEIAQPPHSQDANERAKAKELIDRLISAGVLTPNARRMDETGLTLIKKFGLTDFYSIKATEDLKKMFGLQINTVEINDECIKTEGQILDNTSSNIRQQQRTASNRINSRRTAPSNKIPESAVEMPNADHISSLNVQFGALDFGTDSYSGNEPTSNSSNTTSFSDLQPPKPPTQTKLPPGQGVAAQPTRASSSVTQSSLNQMLTQVQGDPSPYSKTNTHELNQMASQLVSSQQLSDTVPERTKQNVSSNPAASSHHYGPKPGLYNQQSAGGDSGPTQMSYKYGNDAAGNASSHYGAYNQSQSNYGYSSNSSTQPAGYGVNNSGTSGTSYNAYGTATMSGSTNPSNGSHQKISLKELENSSGNSSNLSSQSLGLVSSSTVTTNVLKNTLTATGKSGSLAPNVAPNVNPLLGTPQYLISQPGLSAFYPIYDMPMAGREHNFTPYAPQPGGPSTANEPKYGSRTDPTDTSTGVQSSQAPVTQPAGHLFGQFPPHYGFFYTGVNMNMMPQSLYQTGPFLQVQPPNPAAAASAAPSAHSQGPAAAAAAAAAAGFSKPQSQPTYGSHSAFSNYGLSAQMQVHNQDYSGKGYSNTGNTSGDSQQGSQSSSSGGPNSSSKQNSGTSGNDLSNNNMYTKSHAQLTKNYDKPSFQTGTPPPFNMTNAQMNASALGSYPSQYIPMLQPQSNPSMLHHSLQSDASGGNHRSMGQPQKSSSSNKYYNWG